MKLGDLSNEAWIGLGIYIGLKAAYRRDEMAYRGVDYDRVVAELASIGLLKSGRVNSKIARAAWNDVFPNIIPSQTHQVLDALGIDGHRYIEKSG